MATVSELFVQCLENEGVTTIFGVPGEENEDLLFALENSSIRFIPCRHEQGAAFMADVWGRLTGNAGVCLSTLGPGATNLITGVTDANLDKAPLVAITAQGSQTRLHHESHQYVNIIKLFEAITKWNSSVVAPTTIAEIVRKAFKVAQYEKPGATHIELPEDVAGQQVAEGVAPILPQPVAWPVPNAEVIGAAVDKLRRSERPLILAGRGVIRAAASAQLTTFAETFGIPVATTFMSKGAISDHSPQSLLSIGLGFKDYVMEAVENADLIVAIGYDIAEYPPESWNPNGEKPIIHLDFLPAEVYEKYSPALEVIGDVRVALQLLNDGLHSAARAGEIQYNPDFYAPVRQRILNDIERYELAEGEPFTIPGVLNMIRSTLADDGLLISDVGSHKMWIARNFPTYCPNGCLISNGLATMGIALPGAIAAALLDPDRQIVAAAGDGGFMMNVQELETAKRLGVGFTAVVFRDDDYGLISWKQRRSADKSVSTKIDNADFKALAASFGIEAYQPASKAALAEQLRHTLQERKLAVIEVPVDPRVNDALIEKLDEYWQA